MKMISTCKIVYNISDHMIQQLRHFASITVEGTSVTKRTEYLS